MSLWSPRSHSKAKKYFCILNPSGEIPLLLSSLPGDSGNCEQLPVCSVNWPSCLPYSISHFMALLGPALYGSSPPSLPRPKAGSLLLALSKSTASTPALLRHCRVPMPANISTRLPVPYVKDWHLSRGQLCLMSQSCYLCSIPCLFS